MDREAVLRELKEYLKEIIDENEPGDDWAKAREILDKIDELEDWYE